MTDPEPLSHPLHHPCSHIATPEEQARDARYLACGAMPGQPCRWARRYDGLRSPDFHSERLEAALPQTALDADASACFRKAVLASGLV